MGILKGKLVKKEDKEILKNLDIQAFPWLNFKEGHILFTDNPRKNVILSKYHDPKELNQKVKIATQFKQSLEKKSLPLLPIDLNKDYESGIKELAKRKRRRLMGEEEAMALELAEVDASEDVKFKQKPPSKFKVKAEYSSPEAKFQRNTEAEIKSEVVPETLEEKPILSEKNEEINSIEKTDQLEQVKQDDQENIEKSSNNETKNEVLEDEIIPTVLEQSTNIETQQNGYEKGYLEGFKNGEEIAAKAQESKYESVFENIAHVVDQIEKLKNSLYVQSKEMFLEIIKLSSETILRSQIKYSDEALFSLFDEVVKTISEKSSMKIELNAQDLKRMKQHIEKAGIADRVTLKEDNEKKSGDFSIESDRGISIVSLQKSIENLTEKLELEIMEDEENQIQKAN